MKKVDIYLKMEDELELNATCCHEFKKLIISKY